MPFVVNAAKQFIIGSFDATAFATGANWGVDVDCFVEQASELTKAVSDTGTEAVVSTLTVTIRTRR